MVLLLLVVVAFDLVEAELDVRDFAGYRVDRGKCPAIEARHRLCRADGLGSGGLVDGKRIAAAEAFLGYFGDFSFGGAAPVAQDDRAVALEALEAVDRGGVFLAEPGLEFVADGA